MPVYRRKKNVKGQMVVSPCLNVTHGSLTSLTSLTLPLSPPRAPHDPAPFLAGLCW